MSGVLQIATEVAGASALARANLDIQEGEGMMHTPLTIQTLHWRAHGGYVIRDARNCAVAEVGHIDGTFTDAENREYAALFAAAPKLLAILQEAVHAECWDTELWAHWQSDARAVIDEVKP